jgi:peroxiredoxin
MGSQTNQLQRKSYSARKSKIVLQRKQAKIRNGLILVGGILIFAAIIMVSFSKSKTNNVAPASVGSSINDFVLTDVNGKTVRLGDFHGKLILINAWATWCPPCKAEMPLLNQYYKVHVKDGFALLAVNAGDTQSETASFVDQHGLAFPVLLDPETQLLGQLGVNSFPTSILVGKDGKVKSIHVGMFTSESIEAEVTPLLAQ